MTVLTEIAAEPVVADRGCNGGGAGSGVTLARVEPTMWVLVQHVPRLEILAVSADLARLEAEMDEVAAIRAVERGDEGFGLSISPVRVLG